MGAFKKLKKLAKRVAPTSFGNVKDAVGFGALAGINPVGAVTGMVRGKGYNADTLLDPGGLLDDKPQVEAAPYQRRPMQLSPDAQRLYDDMMARRAARQGGAGAPPPVQATPQVAPQVAPQAAQPTAMQSNIVQQAAGNVAQQMGMPRPYGEQAPAIGRGQAQRGILTMADGGVVPHTSNKSGSHKRNGKPC
jgi:hypothetical protein